MCFIVNSFLRSLLIRWFWTSLGYNWWRCTLLSGKWRNHFASELKYGKEWRWGNDKKPSDNDSGACVICFINWARTSLIYLNVDLMNKQIVCKYQHSRLKYQHSDINIQISTFKYNQHTNFCTQIPALLNDWIWRLVFCKLRISDRMINIF